MGRQVEQAWIGQELAGALLVECRAECAHRRPYCLSGTLQVQEASEADEKVLQLVHALLARIRLAVPAPFLSFEWARARLVLSGSLAGAEVAKDNLKLALALPFDLQLDFVSPLMAPASAGTENG